MISSLLGSIGWAKPTALVLHEFEVHSRGTPDNPAIHRRIQFAAPAGWTRAGTGSAVPEIELVGPNGEGTIAVFAGLHPSHLGPVLSRMKREHPAAQPTPPEQFPLPGLRPELGERATRFAIKGRELGEMVLIERDETIVLFVTVVDPRVWARLRPRLSKMYPTITIMDIKTTK